MTDRLQRFSSGLSAIESELQKAEEGLRRNNAVTRDSWSHVLRALIKASRLWRTLFGSEPLTEIEHRLLRTNRRDDLEQAYLRLMAYLSGLGGSVRWHLWYAPRIGPNE